MADNKTDYLENAVLNHVLRGSAGSTAFAQPTAIYIGLFTATPTETGGGTEVTTTSTGYARQQVTFDAPVSGTCKNSNDVVFPKSTAAWGLIGYFALFDAPTGGNMLYYGTLSATVNVDSANKKVEFEPQSITVTET